MDFLKMCIIKGISVVFPVIWAILQLWNDIQICLRNKLYIIGNRVFSSFIKIRSQRRDGNI